MKIIQHTDILNALNPYYAYDFLNYLKDFLVARAVFLCTTKTEALYSDLRSLRYQKHSLDISAKYKFGSCYLESNPWLMQGETY
jgi:KUP system potassium uptake protein